jgi:hypothetical protein
MARPNIVIEKLEGGLGRRNPNADMVSGIVMNAVATNEMELGKVYVLISMASVEALGLNEAYDTDNEVLVYERLRRIFVRNPSITLYFMPVAQTVTLTEMVDKEEDYAAKLLREQAGNIVQLAVARNPATGYTPTISNGLDEDSVNAVPKAQELAIAEFDKARYCEFIIEGRSFTGTAAAIASLRESDPKCPDVSVVLLADPSVYAQNELFEGYAAVEDVLALVSLSAVSQNAGELIEAFNLTNKLQGLYLTCGLSSAKELAEYTDADLDALHDKGYIFGNFTPGIAGFHLNDTPTATGLDSDYAYIENNRTIKKAIRLARTVLVPRIKSRTLVDPDTGRIAHEDAKELEAITEASLSSMVADGDISGGVDAYVDPAQDVLSTSKIEVLLTFVPVAINRKITLKIGFDNPNR